jgi:hypothetical protein
MPGMVVFGHFQCRGNESDINVMQLIVDARSTPAGHDLFLVSGVIPAQPERAEPVPSPMMASLIVSKRLRGMLF